MARFQRAAGVLLLIGLLIGSGVGFAVGQSLKSVTKDITSTDFTAAAAISPACSCVHAAARFSLTLSREAVLDVAIEASTGGTVVSLARHRSARGVLALTWDGRDLRGGPVHDGVYRVRVRFVGLRSFLVPATITVDSKAPVVTGLVAPTTPLTPGTDGAPGVLRVALSADEPATARIAVYRVAEDGSVARVWWSDPPAALTPGHRTLFSWPVAEGTASVPAAPGTYIVGYEAADVAGNVTRVPIGFAPGELDGAVVARVRTVEVDGTNAVLTGSAIPAVELRRAGGPTGGRLVWAGTTAAPIPTIAGLYLERATVGGTTATGVVAVPGSARVLVVVPTYTWQAASPYDGDGDGLPDVSGATQSLTRPLADLAAADVAELLGHAGRLLAARHPAGAITDQQIEDAGVPRSARTLVLVGATVWTPGLAARIQQFVRRGGRVRLVASPLDHPATRTGTAIVVAGRLESAGILPSR